MISTFKLIWIVVSNVIAMISSYIKTRIAVWTGAFKLFIAFFTLKWNEIPGIVLRIWESIKSGMSAFVEAGKNILKGLFEWFKEKWENLIIMMENRKVHTEEISKLKNEKNQVFEIISKIKR